MSLVLDYFYSKRERDDLVVVIHEVLHVLGEKGRRGVYPVVRVARFLFIAYGVIHEDRQPQASRLPESGKRSKEIESQ